MQNKTMHNSNRMVFFSLCLISIFILIRTAWLGDDAFITLRTIDNWVNGYGLTWNVGERVQTYTHPLWMLLMSGLYFFVRDGYFTALILSIAVSFAVFSIFLKHFSSDLFSQLFGWGILTLSKAFIDYSTSGLENALTHLLILLFAIVLLNPTLSNDPRRFLILALIAGLSATNRMDTILFFIPTLVYLWFTKYRNVRGIGILMVGFSPFILWEVISVFYYGFPFPNTAYAELNSGIPEYELFRQGILYFINSLTWDPITLMITGISLLIAFRQKNVRDKALATGILLYLAYILYIGGDFMSGRFFSAVLLLSAFLLAGYTKEINNSHRFVLSGLILIVGLLSPASTISYFLTYPNSTTISGNYNLDPFSLIADERQYYYQGTSPLLLDRKMAMPRHPWVERGIQYKKDMISVGVEEVIGFTGYFAGPNVHIVDVNAVGDPLLARLNIIDNEPWRIGHFKRTVPAGYIYTFELDKHRIKDPNLAEYYDKLKIIISGNLFSMERLKTIWEMNTGKYDYLHDRYNH